MTSRDWDASTYQRVSGPLVSMGADVLERLVLEGDETILDAGCGTGRVTALLAERLPNGRVIGVDASPAMIDEARALHEGIEFRTQDLLELTVDEPVDAILSTATFHWIRDHDALFARLHRALRPGGRLVAQCGGERNIERVRRAVVAAGAPPADRWEFPGTAATEARLRNAGFGDVWCWTTPAPVAPDDPHTYLRTIILREHVAELGEDAGDALVDAVVEDLRAPDGSVTFDYRRLNILARAHS